MTERRLSCVVGRFVVGDVERAVRAACFRNGIESTFERSHGWLDPDTTLYITLRGDDAERVDQVAAWFADPKTWR